MIIILHFGCFVNIQNNQILSKIFYLSSHNLFTIAYTYRVETVTAMYDGMVNCCLRAVPAATSRGCSTVPKVIPRPNVSTINCCLWVYDFMVVGRGLAPAVFPFLTKHPHFDRRGDHWSPAKKSFAHKVFSVVDGGRTRRCAPTGAGVLGALAGGASPSPTIINPPVNNNLLSQHPIGDMV